MELAEYYGGASSGGMSPMHLKMAHLRSLRGGVGKKTGRVNRSSAFMDCKKREYAVEKNINPLTKWNTFSAPNCPRGIRQPRLKKPLSVARKATLAQKRQAVKLAKQMGTYVPVGSPARLQSGLSAYRQRTACNIDGNPTSLPSLKALARLYGVRGYSKMKKAELCQVIGSM